MKAVFFDRDGTLIVDKNYLYDPHDIEYYPDTFKALRMIQELGYDIFIITNQSGVGRGYFEMKDVEIVHRRLQDDIKSQNLKNYQEIKTCPHHPEQNCDCRKPSPRLITEMIEKYKISKNDSYMLGDKLSDAQAGKNAGIQGVIVRSSPKEGYPFYKSLIDFAHDLKSKS